MIHVIDEPDCRASADERLYFSHQRKSVNGVCNICRERVRLTFDHVPPGGCDNREDMEVSPMFSVMTGAAQHHKPRIIQSGLKYRTICKRCNEFLGSRYDPALIGLMKFVGNVLTSNLLLPRHVKVRTRPGAIL